MIVFGLGTGRCGTKSLVNLISVLKDVQCFDGEVTMHQQGSEVAWTRDYFPPQPVNDLLFDIRSKAIADPVGTYGDVAPYHLPYSKYYEDYFSEMDVRFVVLKRDREETIESYMHWRPENNFWVDHDGSFWKHHAWDKCYPSYDPNFSKREAIGIWHDEYYAQCEFNASRDDRWKVFPMEVFNSIEGLASLLGFLDIHQGNCFMLSHMDFNSDPKHKADYTSQPIDIGT